jgi:hypothetical protein
VKEAQQAAAENDRENDARIDPLLQRQRDAGREREDQDERAFELPQQKPQRLSSGILTVSDYT